jgi:outer membrane protein OmpA-like peptidoglycan-associated protein
VLTRRALIGGLPLLALTAPPALAADAGMPLAADIERRLARKVLVEEPMRDRMSIVRLDPRLRRMAPSIDIYAIHFPLGVARVPQSEWWKIEEIATALERMLGRNRAEYFLVEGHTDRSGGREENRQLSELRAWNIVSKLVREFGIPRHNLEAVGFGEDEPTGEGAARDRRVTLRRITDFLRV